MLFKCQLHEGNVPLSIWTKLKLLALMLIIKRFLRLCKRILIYLKKYLIVLFCIVLFEIIIVPIGIHLDKYASWIDGIWDLRNFFFTSIFISVVGGILYEENNRHKKLLKQFDTYKTFMLESETFLNGLCLCENIEPIDNMYINEELHQIFLSQIYSKLDNYSKSSIRTLDEIPPIQNAIHSTPEVNPQKYITILFERYLTVLSDLKQNVLQSSFIVNMDDLISQLDTVHKKVQSELILIESNSENYTNVQLLRFIECISRCIYPAVAYIRRPWRWDIRINTKMHQLLKEDSQ